MGSSPDWESSGSAVVGEGKGGWAHECGRSFLTGNSLAKSLGVPEHAAEMEVKGQSVRRHSPVVQRLSHVLRHEIQFL